MEEARHNIKVINDFLPDYSWISDVKKLIICFGNPGNWGIKMNYFEQKTELLKKYYKDIQHDFPFYIKDQIPSKLIDHALKSYASGADKDTIMGLYDTTITGNGKVGYMFTDSKIYYQKTLGRPRKLWYDDIIKVNLVGSDELKDCNKELHFKLNDGSVVIWDSCYLNKTPLYQFFNELLLLERASESIHENYYFSGEHNSDAAAIAAGTASGNKGTVNKLYDEERFHARQGHGYAAERANNLHDHLIGHDAKIVGDDNAKNGADRVVDGIEIQSKYYRTATDSINACFEEQERGGGFRYYTQNGEPMKIEVPSDQYDAAVVAMERKIKEGRVPGISDPEEAKNIVRKGYVSYKQAQNIAKAGNVDSLKYDALTGTVTAATAFGVSAMVTLACSIWSGESYDIALKAATFSGLKIGGTAFITSILASQLSKAGLNSALVSGSEAIVRILGPKGSAVLINAFRHSSKIYGAAAMKSAAKLLRGNTITAGVTIVVLSSADVVNIFRGRISGKQLFKNFAETTSTVAGGTAGWIGGSAVGSLIIPGPGSFAGGLIGSVVAGAASNKLSTSVLDAFIEDDAEEMVRILEKEFCNFASDYLLNRKETEKVADKLQMNLDGKKLKEMYSSKNRVEFADQLLIPIIENEISKRKKITVPTEDQVSSCLQSILEEIADTSEETG